MAIRADPAARSRDELITVLSRDELITVLSRDELITRAHPGRMPVPVPGAARR